MNQRVKTFLQVVAYVLLKTWRLWLALVVIIALALWLRGLRDGRMDQGSGGLHIEHSDTIGLTPAQLRAVRSIGQWELLCVETEELVELHKTGLLGSRELVRIYAGRLRIGTDLAQLGADDVVARGDTLCLALPDVALLDSNFIDETRTRSFYERGSWTEADREQLYQKARAAMMRRTLTPRTLEEAREQGRAVIAEAFLKMGFKDVQVSFKEKKQ